MIRVPTRDELRFIFSCWFRGPASSAWGALLAHDYDAAMNRLKDELVRPETSLVSEGADGLLDGFCVFERPDILHYVYVRADSRRRGIGRALMEAAQLPERVRYPARPAEALRSHVPPAWVYSPRLWMRGFRP